MVIPMFREDYENKSLKELTEERNNLLKSISWYEKEFILGETKKITEIYVNPSPELVYKIDNENLIMLTELINEKLEEKQI